MIFLGGGREGAKVNKFFFTKIPNLKDFFSGVGVGGWGVGG